MSHVLRLLLSSDKKTWGAEPVHCPTLSPTPAPSPGSPDLRILFPEALHSPQIGLVERRKPGGAGEFKSGADDRSERMSVGLHLVAGTRRTTQDISSDAVWNNRKCSISTLAVA